MNAHWLGDGIRYFNRVHLGMAVATDDGLIVPVIFDADQKGLREISVESRQLAAKARERKLTPEQYTGSTFSVSNLGIMQIDQFTAIINPPWECGILATVVCILVSRKADAGEARRPYRVGVLNEAWAANHPTVEGLKAGLKALGLEDGRHVSFDIHFTKGDPSATNAAAAALARSQVDLVFTNNEAATYAARDATRKVPIVFTLVGDPVAAGIITQLAHPGGNVTGVSHLTTELVPKRLETLKTLAPTVHRVWTIYCAEDPSSAAAARKAQEAGPRLKLQVVERPVRTAEELERALKELRPGDALLPPAIATMDIPAVILEASLAARIPAVFPASCIRSRI